MKTQTKLVVGKKYKITEDFTTFAKEGHEVGGFSEALTLSAGNSFTVLKERGHNWFEAQIELTERYEPPYGGPAIRWRGEFLVTQLDTTKFEEVE